MTREFDTPSKDQCWRFLASFMFGMSMSPGIRECVRRAYLDLSRTVHGFPKLQNAEQVKRSAHALVESILEKLKDGREPLSMAAFDKWHRTQCEQLCQFYARHKFPDFCVGQAQKWLNMSIKYMLVFETVGVLPFPNGRALWQLAHVPIDNYIDEVLRKRGAPKLKTPWSRIQDYETYFAYQTWCRGHAGESSPLDMEFDLWIKEARRRATEEQS